ncbi:hypothetical protein LINPERPRIM_LOCUS6568 [Linum perenne]
MANPSGTHLEHHNQDATATNSNGPSSSFNGNGINPANGKPESSNSGAALKHNPGISNDWTAEEQSILEDGLSKYASESNIIRYAKIAMQLQSKTVRDVALRCRWMTKKEFSKRRKEDNLSRKSKDKKQNAQALGQISSNLSTMQIQENINLLFRTRDNILKIMNNLNDVPEVMKQMPPLPVKLNEELANAILPRGSIPMK